MSTTRLPGNDIVVTTAFELIGVSLLTLLAGTGPQMGNIVVIIMVGFLLGWLIINSPTLAGWLTRVTGNKQVKGA